jgi:hypothetical protein
MIARRKTFILLGLLIALSVTLTGCSTEVAAIACDEWDFDCLTDQAMKNIRLVMENVEFWSRVNIVGGVSTFLFGMLATLMIALQGDANKRWTRPIGIIATTLVTGISSALVSFHVQENVDKLIAIAGEMADNTTEFGQQTESLKAGKDKKAVELAYRSDPVFRDRANRIVMEFGSKQNKLKMEMMKIKGTAARLNMPNPAANAKANNNPRPYAQPDRPDAGS